MSLSLTVTVVVVLALFGSLGWKVGILATYASEGTLFVCLIVAARAPSWRRPRNVQAAGPG